MEHFIVSLVTTLFLVIIGIIAYIFLLRIKKKENERMKLEEKGESTQDLTNIIDIDATNEILYTEDGYILSLLRLDSISLELMNESEKNSIAEGMVGALSKYGEPWKLIAVSRPVDVKPLIDKYNDMYSEANSDVRKKLLKNAARTMESFALGGEVTERQFYFIIWEKNIDKNSVVNLVKKRALFMTALNERKTRVRIAGKAETIRVCNLFFNPSALSYEDYEEEIAVSFMK